VIERFIGPVWEANHVWLIFIFVILWTSFPEDYASITLTLFVPLTIAALGIVLRGASFAFRKSVESLRYRRIFGAGFAASSLTRILTSQRREPNAARSWPDGPRV
jgi:cytochrome bd ubiquinol oxidase subunit II